MIIKNNILLNVTDSDLVGGTFTFPAGVPSIGYFAFANCTSLITATIPEGVPSIGNYAFCGCTSLVSATIPKGVEWIGDFAFRDCTSLITATIPEGVHWIAGRAFYGCSSLNTIMVFAQSEAEFNRIKALLPKSLHSKAYPALLEFNRIKDRLNALLTDYPAVGSEEEQSVLAEISTLIDAGLAHLERVKSCPLAAKPQQKEFDSLLVTFMLEQQDYQGALEHFQNHPDLSDEVIFKLASMCFSLEGIDSVKKSRALLALFRNHYHHAETKTLLTQSVLCVLNQRPPGLDDTLAPHAIDKCVPLSVIKETLGQLVVDMKEKGDALNVPLAGILSKLHCLTRQEMQHLFSFSPIKEAMENSPKLGSAKIVAYESLYMEQPAAQRSLSKDLVRFLNNTLHLIGVEQRAKQEPSDTIEQGLVDCLLQALNTSEQKKGENISQAKNPYGLFAQSGKGDSSAGPDAAPGLEITGNQLKK